LNAILKLLTIERSCKERCLWHSAEALACRPFSSPAESADEFRKTGTWPQGAILVKEVRSARAGKLTTGDVRWAGEIKAWFVMVKDHKNSFPDNPNWGRGWGWALFKADNHTKNVSTNYKLDCFTCHAPAKNTDWVFQQGYPSLNETEGPFKRYPGITYQEKVDR